MTPTTRLLLLALLCFATRFTGGAPLVVLSEPHPLPTEIVRDSGWQPTIATSGDGFLVNWKRYSLLSAEAGLLDPVVGLDLTPGLSSDMAWNGSEYVIMWHGPESLYATRISADGTVLSRDTPIAEGVGEPVAIRLFWMGNRFVAFAYPDHVFILDRDLILIEHLTDDSEEGADNFITSGENGFLRLTRIYSETSERIVARNLDGRGKRIGTPITLTEIPRSANSDYWEMKPTAAWNGDEYLVVWYRESLNFIRLTMDGEEIGRGTIDTRGAPAVAPTVVASGKEFTVTWLQKDDPANVFSYAASIMADTVTDGVPASPVVLSHNGNWDLGASLAASANGSDVLVAWLLNSGGAVYAKRVGAVDSEPTLVSRMVATQQEPSIAASRESITVAWRQADAVDGELHSRAASAPTAPAGPWSAALDAGLHNPKVASDGNGFAVVGALREFGTDTLYFRAISNDGTGEMLRLSDPLPHLEVSIAFDGREYVVAWDEWPLRRIVVTRISTDQHVVGKYVIENHGTALWKSPAIDCIDGRCLVTWAAHEQSPSTVNQLLGARVDRFGAVDSYPLRIAESTSGTFRDVRVAIDSAGAAVVWTEETILPRGWVPDSRIRGIRVDRDGIPAAGEPSPGNILPLGSEVPMVSRLRRWRNGFALVWREQSLTKYGSFLSVLDAGMRVLYTTELLDYPLLPNDFDAVELADGRLALVHRIVPGAPYPDSAWLAVRFASFERRRPTRR